ncbi:CLAVATA3/ESR (CLE)-related protein 46 [Prunus avium]|uniref:CLAVATA3/ESR (CLE)-related protein 46 n=1 Tax=Prunus avium TaxID=42229 RepID=A0A6P5RH01_PRUAV|nr:CLAVATA3/ESR (CLE)-related protein 46 [Prunus avium]
MHHQLKLNMRRQTPIHLLLVWLLLAASQYHYTINVQAIETVQFKHNSAQPGSGLGSGTRYVLPTWVSGRKIHKTPSGPNPVGNHRPPSKQ